MSPTHYSLQFLARGSLSYELERLYLFPVRYHHNDTMRVKFFRLMLFLNVTFVFFVLIFLLPKKRTNNDTNAVAGAPGRLQTNYKLEGKVPYGGHFAFNVSEAKDSMHDVPLVLDESGIRFSDTKQKDSDTPYRNDKKVQKENELLVTVVYPESHTEYKITLDDMQTAHLYNLVRDFYLEEPHNSETRLSGRLVTEWQTEDWEQYSLAQPFYSWQYRQFNTELTKRDTVMLYETLVHLFQTCEELHILCFMCCGTLRGSYLMHRILPWSGDADVFVSRDRQDVLIEGLTKTGRYQTEFNWFMSHDTLTVRYVKLFSRYAQYKGSPWKEPFVDIMFYEDYGPRVFFLGRYYSKKHIFPLHKRPLGPYWFPSPSDPLMHLLDHGTYDPVLCHNRVKQAVRDDSLVPCSVLKDNLGFVYRVPAQNGQMEFVLRALQVLHIAYVIGASPNSVNNPYSLQLQMQVKKPRHQRS